MHRIFPIRRLAADLLLGKSYGRGPYSFLNLLGENFLAKWQDTLKNHVVSGYDRAVTFRYNEIMHVLQVSHATQRFAGMWSRS